MVALRSKKARVLAVAAVVPLLLGVIGGAFWHWDLRYSQPTPRPPDLVQVPLGSMLPVNEWLAEGRIDATGKPVHLHFFNPVCPCSRFNLDHLHQLVSTYRGRVQFAAVVESDLAESEGGHRELVSITTELGIPWIADRGGRIAAAAGVYSTPQAVIATASGALYYRGNYNTSRYCTDPKTEFARLALESLLAAPEHSPSPQANASPAYGCELPSSKKLVARSTPSLAPTETTR